MARVTPLKAVSAELEGNGKRVSKEYCAPANCCRRRDRSVNHYFRANSANSINQAGCIKV